MALDEGLVSKNHMWFKIFHKSDKFLQFFKIIKIHWHNKIQRKRA